MNPALAQEIAEPAYFVRRGAISPEALLHVKPGCVVMMDQHSMVTMSTRELPGAYDHIAGMISEDV